MTENVKCDILREWVNEICCLTSHDVSFFEAVSCSCNYISVINVTAHRCAGGLKKKLNLRSGSQGHRDFVGFFNVPVKSPRRGHPFYTIINVTFSINKTKHMKQHRTLPKFHILEVITATTTSRITVIHYLSAIRNIATYYASMFTRTCRLSWRHQNKWATLITRATLHEVLSKFSRFTDSSELANSSMNIGLLESENLRKPCTQISCKVFLTFCRKSCPHLGRWLNSNLNGQFVIAIWRIQEENCANNCVLFDICTCASMSAKKSNIM